MNSHDRRKNKRLENRKLAAAERKRLELVARSKEAAKRTLRKVHGIDKDELKSAISAL
jgi:hypothetical protein